MIKHIGGNDITDFFLNITQYLYAFISLIIIIFIIYMVYIIIFRGYPRWIVNILTFSFYHKEDMKQLLKDNIVLMEITNLLNSNGNCVSPYDAYNDIYGISTDIYSYIIDFDKNVTKYYGNIPDKNNQYQQALYEYYLFYHKITDNKSVDIIPDPNNKDKNGHSIHQIVPYASFYNKVLTLQLADNTISAKNIGNKTGNKGNDVLLWEVYTKDKQNTVGYFNRVSIIYNSLIKLSNEILKISDNLKNQSIISFLMLPENTNVINDVNIQLSDKIDMIKNGNIYNNPSTYLSNEYGWFIVEILSYMNNPNNYKTLKQNLDNQTPYYNLEEVDTIRYYLNLPKDKRKSVENKIFNRKFIKKTPGWVDYGQDDNEEKYSVNTSKDFMDFIRKYPILSNIYFSGLNVDDYYPLIMKSYIRFGTNCTGSFTTVKDMLNKLNLNGIVFKNFVNSINFLDLYLNKYQDLITRNIEDQTIAQSEFFHKLFTPYMEDIVNNRIKPEFEKVFSAYTWNKSYINFKVWWKKLGDMLKNVIKSIWKSFFTSSDVDNPQPEGNDDSDHTQPQSPPPN